MTYPPKWRHITEPKAALDLMGTHPFAHLITSHDGLHATRVPLVTTTDNAGNPATLRAHLNAQNPQATGLDGSEVLVVFSGPSTYVSPHWRAKPVRGGTYDYEEVRVRGRARTNGDIAFFRTLIDDLSTLIEPHYAEAGDYPTWDTTMAPEGYIERLHPAVTAFTIDIDSVETISKLHQTFDEEDRRSVADHLMKCPRDESRAIAQKIRDQTDG